MIFGTLNHNAVLKFSPCRNKPLPQALTIRIIYALLLLLLLLLPDATLYQSINQSIFLRNMNNNVEK